MGIFDSIKAWIDPSTVEIRTPTGMRPTQTIETVKRMRFDRYDVITGEYRHQAVLTNLVGDTELPARTVVTFRREPDNQYDDNAIAAFVSGDKMVGYIGRELAANAAPAMDRSGISVFEIVGIVDGDPGHYRVDVCPDQLLTAGPYLATPQGQRRTGTPGSEQATDKQIDYIQSLIGGWDPNPPEWISQEMVGASRKTLAGAMRIAGVSNYEDPESYRHFTKTQASDVITELKKYDP